MFTAGVSLIVVASWMALVSAPLNSLPVVFAVMGTIILFSALKKNLNLAQANLVALAGHMVALLSFYIFYTRIVNVSYVTDAIVGTYMGVLKVLQGQNPYAFSIKPLLDQLGLPPSLYTPRVDGSFEFHLNYPALNFLSLIPLYLTGLHDLRDDVFIFHIAAMLLLFGLVPSKFKALSLAPFAIGFPLAISYSWTDSVWALFILLTAVLWRKNKDLSLVSFGLAVATKQIVLVAAPFLLVRLWKEAAGSRLKRVLRGVGLMLSAFLVPNIPFIVASPSLWWVATVAPYLPGGVSMAPGGVGLSEILSDLGLALSPVFYIGVSAIVGVTCLAVFFTRYQRASHFTWAMPIFVLFCYYRSLPNYLVFWVIPFIFEWFNYGNPRLSGLRGLLHPLWRRAFWSLAGVLKGRVGPSILLITVLAVAVAGASGAYVTQVSGPRVDVKLDSMADTDYLGVATNLEVTVTNHGPQAISPIFFVKWFFLWDLWKANQTQMLPAGSSATYLLTATDGLAGVPRGDLFHVAVFDSVTGQFVAQSQSTISNVARPPVANPRFTWWTLDEGSGRQTPFEWKLGLAGLDPSAGGIGLLNQTTASGVQFRLNTTLSLLVAGEVDLSQRLMFNETNLNVLLYHPQWSVPLGGTAFGARVTDGVHILYFLFSGEAGTVTIARFAQNTTVTVPVAYSSWSTVTLNIRAIWLSQAWNAPASLDFSLFLRSNQAGLFLASVQQLVESSSPSQPPAA